MKTKYYFISLLFLSAYVLNAQQVRNRSFEFWHTDSIYSLSEYLDSGDEGLHGISPVPGVTSGLGVRLETLAIGEDVELGYFVNFIPDDDPSQFRGGVDYSEHVDTIHGYYQAAIQPQDTAWLLVWFKKNGNVIGGGIYPFTANDNTSNWTLFEFPTNMPPGETPDTLMLGAASGNFRADTLIAGSVLALDNLTFIANGQPVTQQAPNNEFEYWDIYAVEKPDSLVTSLENCVNTDPLPVEKYTPATDGSYAIQLTTVLKTTQDTTAGFVTNGIPYDNWPPKGGDPLYDMPIAVSYDYISNLTADTASVGFYFKLNGQVISSTGQAYNTVSGTGFTHVRLPLYLSQTPDTVVYALFSGFNPGSQLIVDNILLEYAAAIDDQTEIRRLEAFPNPANDILHFRIASSGSGMIKLTIYDESGKEIFTRSHYYEAGKSEWKVDIGSLPKGIYSYIIEMNGKAYVHKFIKN